MNIAPTRGMTMIETIVYVALFGFMMVTIMSSVLYFYKSNSYVLQEANSITSAQRGIDTIVRILRESSYASNGAYPIASMGANDLKFFSDIDQDSMVEEVHYYLSGLNLNQGIINPTGDPPVYGTAESTTTISDYVHNVDQSVATFTYYDKNGAQITDYTKIGDVRFITVNLIVDLDPNKIPFLLTLRSSAALRNLIGR